MLHARLRAAAGSGRLAPGDIFSSGEVGAWLEISPEYLFQDSAGTIPVTTSGDPVGYIEDLSGNGVHATQSNNSLRPVYGEGGGLRWIDFSGGRVHLEFLVPFSLFSSGLSYCLAYDQPAATGTRIFYSRSDSFGGWAFIISEGSSSTVFSDVSGSGAEPSVSLRADGQAVSPLTRDTAFTATQGRAVQTWEASGATGSYVSTSTTGLGAYESSGIQLDGKLYGLIWRESFSPSERSRVEGFLSEKAGI